MNIDIFLILFKSCDITYSTHRRHKQKMEKSFEFVFLDYSSPFHFRESKTVQPIFVIEERFARSLLIVICLVIWIQTSFFLSHKRLNEMSFLYFYEREKENFSI